MKILFLSHYCGLLGSNRSLDSLITYFVNRGENISVLLPSRGEFYQHLKSLGRDVHSFLFVYETLYVKKNKKYLSLPILWLYNLLVFPFLLFKIQKMDPDVIYTNSSSDLYSVFFAKILGIRHVVHVREFMQEDFGGYCVLGRSTKKKVLLKSDKLIFVSQAVARAVVGEIPEYGKVIYNGLPVPHKDYLCPKLKDNVRIAVVGNIDISKQQDLAIKMMPKILEKFPHSTLHLIGDKECPYRKYIKGLVKKLNIEENVIFEGFVKDVEDIYSKFDILLMCSRSEAFGRVTIEAMLRRKPVIGYEAGGTPELIDDGVTGFKFKNVDDVLRALDIVVHHHKVSNQIVENAYAEAMTKFSETAYVNNVFNYVVNEPWNK